MRVAKKATINATQPVVDTAVASQPVSSARNIQAETWKATK